MGEVYNSSINILHNELLRKRDKVEQSLAILIDQNTEFAGDHRRMIIFYNLLLSHFGDDSGRI